MSGSRGIRPRGAPNNLEFSQNYTKQRYQHQQPFSINPTPPTGNWSDDTWGWSPNIPNWDNQPNNQTWPSAQHYRGRGGHQYGRGDYKVITNFYIHIVHTYIKYYYHYMIAVSTASKLQS